MGNSSRHSYNGISKSIHWLMGGLFIYVLSLGLVLENMDQGPDKMAWLMQHKSLGALLGILAVLRIVWRFVSKTPDLPARMPCWQKIAARLNLVVLYGAMLGLPFTGYLMSVAAGYPVVMLGIELPVVIEPNKTLSGVLREVHGLFGTITLVALALHILGALHHHIIAGDDVLRRMLPDYRRRAGNATCDSRCLHSNTNGSPKLDYSDERVGSGLDKARSTTGILSTRTSSGSPAGDTFALAAAASTTPSGSTGGGCASGSGSTSSSPVSCDSPM